jgi:hypothetical protein
MADFVGRVDGDDAVLVYSAPRRYQAAATAKEGETTAPSVALSAPLGGRLALPHESITVSIS